MGMAAIMVRLGLDASGFKLGMKQAESSASRLGAALKSRLAAYFSVGAVAMATKSVVSWADKIKDLSDDLGISTRTLQEWEYAAAGTRATIDDFTRAFDFLAKANPQMTTAQIEKEFVRIAEAFRNGEMTLGELEIALGRSSGVLAGPFTNGLKAATEAAAAFNAVLSDDQLDALANASDEWDKFSLKARVFFAEVIAGSIKAIRYIGFFAQSLKKWKGGFPAMAQELTRLMAGESAREAEQEEKREAEKAARAAERPGEKGKKEADKEAKAKPETETTTTTKSEWLIGTANQLQQVGAFMGVQPILLTETKEQTKVLKKIEANTASVKEEMKP